MEIEGQHESEEMDREMNRRQIIAKKKKQVYREMGAQIDSEQIDRHSEQKNRCEI